MSNSTPYELLGGESGLKALANAFYDAMDELPEAAVIRAMHDEKLDEIKHKLFEYLSGWLGGPSLYAERTGSVCLTKPHSPYAIGPAERDQWLMCMDRALEVVNASEEVRQMLKMPMFRVADAIRNRDSSAPVERDPNVIAVG
ncbi:MAG TPA: group II truncated hemoglobin [Spongiibacteraceae bacterium]|jgi:hemoglobin|nr:group II truncated hemoglobin [Spongiibacteraceae bacterium]HUH37465.1 group II truncated hemoglobin [Spongiibacteraceae bacterium]